MDVIVRDEFNIVPTPIVSIEFPDKEYSWEFYIESDSPSDSIDLDSIRFGNESVKINGNQNRRNKKHYIYMKKVPKFDEAQDVEVFGKVYYSKGLECIINEKRSVILRETRRWEFFAPTH